MFAKKPTQSAIELDVEISRIIANMEEYAPHQDEYVVMADQLSKLRTMKDNIPSTRFSPDALLAVAGNLAAVGAIILFEKNDVLTTKATMFLGKFTR